MRPRIQATISQKAYDIIIAGMDEVGGPLFNLTLSRAVDRIILEWEEGLAQIRNYQETAAKYYSEIRKLKKELGEV